MLLIQNTKSCKILTEWSKILPCHFSPYRVVEIHLYKSSAVPDWPDTEAVIGARPNPRFLARSGFSRFLAASDTVSSFFFKKKRQIKASREQDRENRDRLEHIQGEPVFFMYHPVKQNRWKAKMHKREKWIWKDLLFSLIFSGQCVQKSCHIMLFLLPKHIFFQVFANKVKLLIKTAKITLTDSDLLSSLTSAISSSMISALNSARRSRIGLGSVALAMKGCCKSEC